MTGTWSNEKIIDFINEVHLYPQLWNVECGTYKHRNAKKDGWADVAQKFNISTDEAYKKFRSLRTYAKTEERKKKSGSAGGKPVKWFAFDAISFVLTQDTPNTGLDSENSSVNVVTETLDTAADVDQEQEVVNSETTDSLLSSESIPKPPNSKKSKSKNNTDPFLEKAQQILLQSGNQNKNEYSAFGEHIANKLTKYDPYTRSQAEMKIMQILYDCDMARFRQNSVSSAFTPSPDKQSRAGASSEYSDVSLPASHSRMENNLQHVYVPRAQNFAALDQMQPTQSRAGTNSEYSDVSPPASHSRMENNLQHVYVPRAQNFAAPDQMQPTQSRAGASSEYSDVSPPASHSRMENNLQPIQINLSQYSDVSQNLAAPDQTQPTRLTYEELVTFTVGDD